MPPDRAPRDRTIAALRAVWASIGELIADLDDRDWRRPSPLPAWDVQANVAHILGTEALLLGEQPPPSIEAEAHEHIHNPIGAMNEAWVAALATSQPAEVRDRFQALTRRRLDALDAMSDDEWAAEGFTPAGRDAYGRFMQIRVFDCWMHEQDIRVAVDCPGHESGVAVDVSLDEMSNAMGFVVGKRAGAPADSSVTFDLTGPAARQIHVEVGQRARVVPGLVKAATAVLTMPVLSFSRIAGGRLDSPQHIDRCAVHGDEVLGRRILDNLSYTI